MIIKRIAFHRFKRFRDATLGIRPTGVTLIAGGNNSGKTDEGGLGEGAPPEDYIFVLTGNMNDGTPFWAEDHAVVQGDAR